MKYEKVSKNIESEANIVEKKFVPHHADMFTYLFEI